MNSKIYVLFIILVGIAYNSMQASDHEYIVNTIKKQSNITKEDVDAWKVKDLSARFNILKEMSTRAKVGTGAGVSGTALLYSRLAKPGKKVMRKGALLAALATGSGYALYRYKTISYAQVIEKIRKYVELCQTLILVNKRYDKADDLLLGLVENHNAAWIGKSYVAIFNALQNLIEQGSYALELIEQLKPYEDKEMLSQLEKKISSYIVRCAENQRAIGNEYRIELKTYKKAASEATDLSVQKLNLLSNQWKLLKSIGETGYKVVIGAGVLWSGGQAVKKAKKYLYD